MAVLKAVEEEIKREFHHYMLMQGYRFKDGQMLPPDVSDKDRIRKLHAWQRLERFQASLRLLDEYGSAFAALIANGAEVDCRRFNPVLVSVSRDPVNAAVFRIASLTWSVPVSEGYGRRLKYLVVDQHNGKLVGLIALGDPVFNLRVRDEFIGWDVSQRKERLYNVLDAYVLGAVPPYSYVLCGKLMALLAVSNEVRRDVYKKYYASRTIIQGVTKDPRVAAITTTSALGRSSIYNRLKFRDEKVFRSLGFTSGFGHFHIPRELFEKMRAYLVELGDPYATGNRYGDGPNWHFRVIRRCLDVLGLGDKYLRHCVKREVFIALLASNSLEFLRGETNELRERDWPAAALIDYFKERWMIPRSTRCKAFVNFKREDLLSELLLKAQECRDWQESHGERAII